MTLPELLKSHREIQERVAPKKCDPCDECGKCECNYFPSQWHGVPYPAAMLKAVEALKDECYCTPDEHGKHVECGCCEALTAIGEMIGGKG